LPKIRQDAKRIGKAIAEAGSQSVSFCAFEGHIKAEYEYEGENFCIMHLPFIAKEQKQELFEITKEKFQELIKLGLTRYDFVNAEGLTIGPDIEAKYFSFIGADLWSISICATIKHDLIFKAARLQGENKISGNIDRIIVMDCDCSSDLSLASTQASQRLIQRSTFHASPEHLRFQTNNHKICLDKAKIDNFTFVDNDCNIYLELDHAEIKTLDLGRSRFGLCPSFFNTDFADKNKHIFLPNRQSFNIKQLRKDVYIPSNFTIFCNYIAAALQRIFKWNARKKIGHHLKPNLEIKPTNSLWRKFSSWCQVKKSFNPMEEQYRRFLEIYNIVKKRGMYFEQGEYFYLMQYCFECTNKGGMLNNIFSRAYRFFSDYGTNIFKPIGSLIATWFLFGCLYHWHFLLSAQQIVKPYAMFFDETQKHTTPMYYLGALESTAAITFIALLILH
jgi:hypothetical protein